MHTIPVSLSSFLVCNFTCANGGTVNNNCTACNCPPQFTGVRCELDFDECISSPCQNGGLCTNIRGNFTCTCPSNFTGRLCETDVNECIISTPCLNMGTCRNTIGGFECMCRDGFTGDRCQFEIDECFPNPCMNGGNCTDLIANFTCGCQPNFDGRLCEICAIPNCMTCSRTEEDVCEQCANNFFLRAGSCCEYTLHYCVNRLWMFMCLNFAVMNFQEVCPVQESEFWHWNSWNFLIHMCQHYSHHKSIATCVRLVIVTRPWVVIWLPAKCFDLVFAKGVGDKTT